MDFCGSIKTWADNIQCIYPYSWAYFGVAMSIALSIAGAVWGIFLTGASLLGSAIKAPRVKTKNLVSVVFCEAVAIYGVIMAIIMAEKVVMYGQGMDIYSNKEAFALALRSSLAIFWTGIGVGLSNLICGVCVGVSGQSCVLADALDSGTFIKILVVEIFGSALGLFGLIIGVMQAQMVQFPIKSGF